MKFLTIVTLLASAIAVASAALPVEPKNAITFQEDYNQQQHVVEDRPVSNGYKSYIVVFKESTALEVIEKAVNDILGLGGKIGQRYTSALKGFSASIPAHIMSALSTNPYIDYIEEDGEEDDEFAIEPCSMWVSFVHAALHYVRLSLELAPIGQKIQLSVHAAPGVMSDDSAVLNTWTDAEQSLEHITSQLKLLQMKESDVQDTPNTESLRPDWIEQALKGAIAHILESDAQPASFSQTTSSIPALQLGVIQHRRTANIVMVLLDPEGHHEGGDEDISMEDPEDRSNGSSDSWQFFGKDLREMLGEAIRSLQDYISSSRIANINVDFIRISTAISRSRKDVVSEEIARVCTASVYNVIAEDELSASKALTNYYLLRERDVRLVRIDNMPLKMRHGNSVELLYRTDHISTLARKAEIDGSDGHTRGYLQRTPSTVQMATELIYGTECKTNSYALPTQCAHIASISPSTFASYFSPFSSSGVHFLKDQESSNIASMALFDHYGRLFLHCLQTSKDSSMFLPLNLTSSASKRKADQVTRDSRLDDFVQVVVRPNTISSNVDSFAQDGNIFTEITPSALPNATLNIEGDSDKEPYMVETPNSRGVNMALVHTTSKLDLETRWLVQWEGERVHPVMPAHEVHIKMFRAAICRETVDATGFSTIQSLLDTLITEARPPFLPGEQLSAAQVKEGKMFQHAARIRESAQAILADLWMIGQRFKSVSPSHLEAARLIATKITPKGVDHQTVKLTLVPPNRRPDLLNELLTGQRGSSGTGSGAGTGPGNAGNTRGNDSGFNRGGRGGRFEFGRGRGRGGMGGQGGFRGGQGGNTGSPGNGNSNNNNNNNSNNSSNTDDMNFGGNDPAVPSGPMLSLTGKTQPKPYLETRPPTRKEIEESEQEYLGQLGEDGCLLKAYWGSRGAQGSSIATVLNSVTSLDSPSPTGVKAAVIMDPLLPIAAKRKIANVATKRLRLQDFAGRTPSSENGGHTHGQV
ncbi:hypothetical protein BGZ67_009499 [Mortierella alpina]|nr:hypothetical protein BGZ67_009499 [Mortierella alpina]